MCPANGLFHGGLNSRAHNSNRHGFACWEPKLKGVAMMRRNLAVLVCAAGCVCLAGCHRYERSYDSSYNTSLESRNLSETGTSGSSASPYTMERRQYRGPIDTGYSGSSAAPNTYNRDSTYRSNTTYDTRPGMVNDKKTCPDK
jgi:hypothetical protein